MADASKSELIIEEHPEPGVVRKITSATNPGLILEVVTPEEWEKRTGMGDHVSLSFGGVGLAGSPEGRQPSSAEDAGEVVCPACQGEGFLGWVGTASTCVFCLGERAVSAAEARRYDPQDALRGAEPTLRRLEILIYQLDPYQGTYPYERPRMWLDRYGFTLERLQAELDAEDLNDQLDLLWGFDGRQYAGEDFSAGGRWDACDFSGSTLTGANFHAVDLTGSVFNAADLTEASLTGANLTRTALREATLARAALDGAILVGADLSGANLSDASLVGANLLETTFDDAEVTGADFRGVTSLDPSVVAELRVRGAVVDEAGT